MPGVTQYAMRSFDALTTTTSVDAVKRQDQDIAVHLYV
jgi:hypothetical protein